jgi:DUF1680 family protein
MELVVKARFPFETAVHCKIKTNVPSRVNLRIRVPSWASKAMEVSVKGIIAGAGKPGTYLSLIRQWSDGDVIEFNLPATVRMTRYTGEDQIAGKLRYSFEYGPILLAAVGSSTVDLVVEKGHTAETVVRQLEPDDGSPLHLTVAGNAGQKLVPYFEIEDEEFTCYPTVTVSA